MAALTLTHGAPKSSSSSLAMRSAKVSTRRREPAIAANPFVSFFAQANEGGTVVLRWTGDGGFAAEHRVDCAEARWRAIEAVNALVEDAQQVEIELLEVQVDGLDVNVDVMNGKVKVEVPVWKPHQYRNVQPQLPAPEQVERAIIAAPRVAWMAWTWPCTLRTAVES